MVRPMAKILQFDEGLGAAPAEVCHYGGVDRLASILVARLGPDHWSAIVVVVWSRRDRDEAEGRHVANDLGR